MNGITRPKLHKILTDRAIDWPRAAIQRAVGLPGEHPREPEIDQIVLQAGPTGMAGFVPIGQDLAYLFLNVPWDRSRRPSPERSRGDLAGEAGAVRRPDWADPRHVHRRPGRPTDADVADAFTRYAARRYERCKFIVEASVQVDQALA